ncbi:MAG: alpha/beta hydrolase [Ruminococcus sp.]|nr:alpha/beta hydrolase [Ruminococcus sp.]
MSYFVYEGKKVYYEEQGTGRPLLLLHGNTASSRMFAQAAEAYSRSFRVILIDFLGHGRSDRLNVFPSDLWYYEAQQVIAFLREKQLTGADIIGSSGGAIVAVNTALEAPELVGRLIADSFEGEAADERFTKALLADREKARLDAGARGFYEYMHGPDWEQIVDNDTDAIIRHQRERGDFFRKPLTELRNEILLTGSRGDSFMYSISDEYYEKVYGEMLEKLPKGRMYIFSEGGHPAMLSNFSEFYELSIDFLTRE